MLASIVVLLSFFSMHDYPTTGQILHADTIQYPASVQRAKNPFDSSGHFIYINRIFIIGNKITRDQIILRELLFKSGDMVYSQDLPSILETDRRKVYNTRLFNTVEVKALALTNDTTDILVDVHERWYMFPSPIFELSDRNFNEWWQNYNHDFNRVNYGLRLYQYNFRGRNETVRATFQFGFTRNFSLAYRIPYIDRKQKQGLGFEFGVSESKNVAYRTVDHKFVFIEEKKDIVEITKSAGISYSYRNSFYESHSINLDYQDATIADTVAILNPSFFKNTSIQQKYFSLQYAFNSDHRDIAAYPLRGRYLFASARHTGFMANGVNKTELQAGYARYFQLKHNFNISNYSYGYISTPNNQPYNLLGTLGYSNQVIRGYEIYVIEGPQFILNKTTFKKKIFSHNYKIQNLFIDQFSYLPIAVYLKTYADLGYVKNYASYERQGLNTRLSNQLLFGTGMGLDIVTSYDTVIRLEYSINHEGVSGFYVNLFREF